MPKRSKKSKKKNTNESSGQKNQSKVAPGSENIVSQTTAKNVTRKGIHTLNESLKENQANLNNVETTSTHEIAGSTNQSGSTNPFTRLHQNQKVQMKQDFEQCPISRGSQSNTGQTTSNCSAKRQDEKRDEIMQAILDIKCSLIQSIMDKKQTTRMSDEKVSRAAAEKELMDEVVTVDLQPNSKQQKMDELIIEGFMSEQIKANINHCLFCLYNKKEFEEYFDSLLQVQQKLIKWPTFSVQSLYDLIMETVSEYMHAIQKNIVDEMKKVGLVRRLCADRRHSQDDYWLINNVSHNSGKSANNEFAMTGPYYLSDMKKYEDVRRKSRFILFSEQHASRYRLLNFLSDPEHYYSVFNLLINSYMRIKEGWLGLEEIWIFLVESVYHRTQQGYLIFEDQHKQLFKREVLQNKFIDEFLKEISKNFATMEQCRQQDVQSPYSLEIAKILSDLGQNLLSLESDVSTYLQDNESDDEMDTQSEDSTSPITYQQLRKQICARYGGQSLVQLVTKLQMCNSSSKQILKQVMRTQRSAAMIENLKRFDSETLSYMFKNNITTELCEQILRGQGQKSTVNKEMSLPDKDVPIIDSDDDDIQTVSSEKDSDKKAPKASSDSKDKHREDSSERARQKRKEKNAKKKRRRQEKKVIRDQQDQIEQLWYKKLREELESRRWQQNYSTRQSRVVVAPQQVMQMKSKELVQAHNKADATLHNDEEEIISDRSSSTDASFEDLLEKFNSKLSVHCGAGCCDGSSENPNQLFTDSSPPHKNIRKLKPNVPDKWLATLKKRLDSDVWDKTDTCASNYSSQNFTSPRTCDGSVSTQSSSLTKQNDQLSVRYNQHQKSA